MGFRFLGFGGSGSGLRFWGFRVLGFGGFWVGFTVFLIFGFRVRVFRV